MVVKLPRVLDIVITPMFNYARVQTRNGSIVWRARCFGHDPVEVPDSRFDSMSKFIFWIDNNGQHKDKGVRNG